MNRTTTLTILGGMAFTGFAFAQADFVEGFDANGVDTLGGPANLVAQGWEFRNQSDPSTGSAWYDGDGFGGQAFEGGGYLASSSLATDSRIAS